MALQFLDATTINMGEIFLSVLGERLSDTGDIWGEKPRLHINGITFRRRETDKVIIPVVETFVILGGLYKNGNYYKVSPFGDVPGKYDYQHKLCFYSLNPTTYRKICEQRIRDALSEIILHQRDYLPERMCGVTVQQTSLAHEVSLQSTGHSGHSLVVIITPAIEGDGIPAGVREPVLRNIELERLRPTWLIVPCSRRSNELQSWNITFQPLESTLLQRSAMLQQSVLFLTWIAEKLGWGERGITPSRIFTCIACIQLHVSDGAFAYERFTIQVKVLLMQLRSHLHSNVLEDIFVVRKNLLETLSADNSESIQLEIDEILQNEMQTPSAVDDYIRSNYPYYITRVEDEGMNSSDENLVVKEILEKNANFSLPENEVEGDGEQGDGEVVYYEDEEDEISADNQEFIDGEPLGETLRNYPSEVLSTLSIGVAKLDDVQEEQNLEDLQKEVITTEIFAKRSSEARVNSDFEFESPLQGFIQPNLHSSKSNGSDISSGSYIQGYQDSNLDLQGSKLDMQELRDNQYKAEDLKENQFNSKELHVQQYEAEDFHDKLYKTEDVRANQFRSEDVQDNQFKAEALQDNQFNVEAVQDNQFNVEAVQDNQFNVEAVQDNQFNVEAVQDNQFNVEAVQDNQFNVEAVQVNQFNVEAVQVNQFNVEAVQDNHLNVEDVQFKANELVDEQFNTPAVQGNQFRNQDVQDNQFKSQDIQGNHIVTQALEGTPIIMRVRETNHVSFGKQDIGESNKGNVDLQEDLHFRTSSSGDVFGRNLTQLTKLSKSAELDKDFVANGTPVLLNGNLENTNGHVSCGQETSPGNGSVVSPEVELNSRSMSVMDILGTFHNAFVYSILAFIVVSLGIAWMLSTDVESIFPGDNQNSPTSEREL